MSKKFTLGAAVALGFLLVPLVSQAQQPAPAATAAPAAATAPAGESADALLARIDKQNNAFKDALFHFKMRILESSGAREVEFETKQKGNSKRLVRFLAPADVKGMGFLSESADVMYALLPAFGNRVRRVGSHQMNQSFMGSDLSTADMNVIDLAPFYSAKLTGVDKGLTTLELTLRPGKQSEFPKLKMWADATNATISKVEYFDASGKKLRTAERFDFVKDSPEHFSPGKMVYTDHRRGNHQTELVLVKSKLNNGFTDEDFTQRALTRE